MDHNLLQKSRIYSNKKILPVVDFRWSWTTVLLLSKLCIRSKVCKSLYTRTVDWSSTASLQYAANASAGSRYALIVY